MQNLVQDFFEDAPSLTSSSIDWTSAGTNFVPRLDVAELDDKITLSIELPGMSDKDIDIQMDQDCLTIKGEKKQEKSAEGSLRSFDERCYGSFQRKIYMPTATIDKDKITASFKHGILMVAIPKHAEAKKEYKKIPITAT
jgi:HSP20 family protein